MIILSILTENLKDQLRKNRMNANPVFIYIVFTLTVQT